MRIRVPADHELQMVVDSGGSYNIKTILERIEAAIVDTSKELHAYTKAHVEFMEIGNRMLQQWEEGVALSLKAASANRLFFGD